MTQLSIVFLTTHVCVYYYCTFIKTYRRKFSFNIIFLKSNCFIRKTEAKKNHPPDYVQQLELAQKYYNGLFSFITKLRQAFALI